MTNPIRWGIIGCGDVCEKKSGPAFYKTENSALISVMRRDAGKAADFARRHGVAKSTSDADEILNDPEIDIVYVATPPGSHCEYALRVAEAGKHCYVEKPMARNADEAGRMIEAFAEKSLKLFVAYYRRCLPVFVKAKSLLDERAIGRLTSILHRHTAPVHRTNAGWRLDAKVSGGGLFLDLGSHVLDALDYLTGAFQSVQGRAVNIASGYDVEDSVVCQWQTPDGALGCSMWNFASDQAEDLIELCGTEGKISFAAFGPGSLKLTRGSEVQEFNLGNPMHVHQPLVQTIVDELRGAGSCPSTGESARRTQVVMDQCLDAYYGGRSDEFWLRQESWPGRRGG